MPADPIPVILSAAKDLDLPATFKDEIPRLGLGRTVTTESLEAEGVSDSDRNLVAYLVSHTEQPSASELRQFLQRTLPDYMVPSSFVYIERMPLTANGKLDRNALPAPDGARPQLEQIFAAPRSEIEELIAQVWRQVLQRDRIGIHDNFFDLGGHSLLATRVVARLRANFNIDVALRKLFELPTVAALAPYVAQLRRGEAAAGFLPILPAPRTAPLPLSFSQRRLWYLHKVDGNLSAYNIPAVFRLEGALDGAALERALNEMIARHEVLRSYVVEIDGQPRQESLPSLNLAVSIVDLSHLPMAQAEYQAQRLAAVDAPKLYDLTSAPLLRATLVKLADSAHVLILNFHHLIADGSSLAIFYRELAALYDAARSGKPIALPPLPIQYGDYAAWQTQWLNSAAGATQLDYWQRQLTSLPQATPLPSDFDRAVSPTYQGARLAAPLTTELTTALKELSRRHNATLFMTLFAAFNVLLSRLSGQEDLVIGTTIAGRNHPETDGLIGFFINALPLRGDLAGAPSFAAVLRQVRERCLDAYTHQDVPFEKIVEALKPRREIGRNPLFDILFNVADVSERALELSGCAVSQFAAHEPAAKFDLVVSAPENNHRIELALVYNTALFRAERIALLLDQFVALLGQITAAEDLPIGQYSLLTGNSRAALPNTMEPLDDRWHGAIHDLLSGQAGSAPTKLAVADPEQSWTYAELESYANRLAWRLIDSGITPHDSIAIYAHRSAPLALALFATLKAGAPFLILDPADPPARSADYLRIGQIKGWLQLDAAGELPAELALALADLDLSCRIALPKTQREIISSLAAYDDRAPAIAVAADTPAYIAFTSGSTGEPKGVICRHGPITHFLPWQKSHFSLKKSDRFAMLSGLAYSHLHRDLFTAIFLGATLYIPDPAQAREPGALARWIDRHAITVLHLTPALGQLLRTGRGVRLPSVRRIYFGGDVLTTDDVAATRSLAPNATIGSFYGASETQRAVGYYEISKDAAEQASATDKIVPLGHGIVDVQLLVLTRHGQLAGVGELGEIFVRSPHLAEGYIGDRERTARMFVVNPFTQDARDRLYRSGELGKYRADGAVQWSGRNDRRVNIRGFRVELEEIEIALKQHPTVKDAAVTTRHFDLSESDNPKSKSGPADQNPKFDERLAAYIAADEQPQSLADLLQSYLSTRLPHYMVPAHYVILPSLPLTANGKIDYRALPAPRLSSASAPSTAARDATEKQLCGIFAELLGRPDVGAEENFFRIGGHSLLAARAAARIADLCGVQLDLSAFLDNPTAMGLAGKVKSLRAAENAVSESDQTEREEFDL